MEEIAIPASPSLLGLASLWEAPAPVLLNTWKHHAGALRQRMGETVRVGPAGLPDLARELVVIGSELMDLYIGTLHPWEIGQKILAQLDAAGNRELAAYRQWIEASGGYGVITLPEDDSRWVLRFGDGTDRYIHLHPARWAPQTCRVRANVLKTAVMVLATIGVQGGDPGDLKLVNAVRQRYLGLAPLGKSLNGDQGIGAVLDLLASGAT